jgi:hypothetical protein
MLKSYKYSLLIVLLLSFLLSACGTLEIGIENNFPVETADILPATEPPQVTVVPTQQPEQTQEATLTDEQQIALALEQKLGQPAEQLGVVINTMDGEHATGGVSNGYFLAAKQGESWVIVYDGQATPPCIDIEQYRFPVEMVPECLDEANLIVMRTGGDDPYSQAINSLQSLDCGLGSPGADPGAVEYVACNIQDALRSRNISTLLSYLEDPFIIGYWLSEGVFYSPQDFLAYLPQLYNFNDPNYMPRLSFTMDRSQFPVLDGRPLEDRFGPETNIAAVVYSEGWGEGDQEALIFISQNPAGEYKWYSMLYGDLDVPMPSPVEN